MAKKSRKQTKTVKSRRRSRSRRQRSRSRSRSRSRVRRKTKTVKSRRRGSSRRRRQRSRVRRKTKTVKSRRRGSSRRRRRRRKMQSDRPNIQSSPRRSKNCIQRSNLTLNLHQKNAVKKCMKEDGYIFIHGTGSGKTLSAVTASQCFLDRHPKRKVIFVGPTSLLRNFEKELVQYGVPQQIITSKYEMVSFTGMLNRHRAGDPIDCAHNMLIIDEAHNLRNRREAKKQRGHAIKGFSARYSSILACAAKAKKRLLLTATPIVNSLADLSALINFIYGRNLVGTRDEVVARQAEIAVGKTMTQENIDKIYKLMKGRMDYFTDIAASKFPLTRQHYVEVPMPASYRKQYEKYIRPHEDNMDYYFEHPDAFYNAQRRVVNKVADDYFSAKIGKVLDKIRQGKTLIYTNWLDFGVQPIKTTLAAANISYGVFTGKLSKDKRDKLVREFNNDEIDAMILTSAGAEGLDLKGTKNVIILDPPWHPAGLNQIIGRAVRYASHQHLPKHERKVNIYKMVMVEKSGMRWNNATTISGDALLYQIIEKKSHLTREVHNLLERIDRATTTSSPAAVRRKYGLLGSSDDNFIVYGRATCPYTVQATDLLKSKSKFYRFYDMEEHPEKRLDFETALANANLSVDEKKKHGFEGDEYPYVPAIFKNTEFIGGFEDLSKMLK